MTDTTRSNSLTDLAARINAAHDAAAAAIKSSVTHAIQAGDLLIEAKEQLGHGEWLPWLKANFAFSDRTARLYMQVARRREEVEAKLATVADLTLRDVFEEPEPEPGTWEWAEKQVKAPINDSDLRNPSLLLSKMMTQARVPVTVALWHNIGRDYGLDCLCLCPSEDLAEALKALAPYVRSANRAVFSVALTQPLEGWVDLTLNTQRLFYEVWTAATTRYGREHCEQVFAAAQREMKDAEEALHGKPINFDGRKGAIWDDIRGLAATKLLERSASS
jgi:Protein of unknown function (DUF3102)